MSFDMDHDGSMSVPFQKPWLKINGSSKYYCFLPLLTWKIFGALTRDANADDRVAEKIPAEISGANPDTMLMTWKKQNYFLKYVKKMASHKQKKATMLSSLKSCLSIMHSHKWLNYRQKREYKCILFSGQGMVAFHTIYL